MNDNKLKYNTKINPNNKENIFNLQLFGSVSNPYTFTIDNNYTINAVIESNLTIANLFFYAKRNIVNYSVIRSIPEENIKSLNSGLIATDMQHMFEGCTELQTIPKLYIDTSQCASMYNMFYLCQSLMLLDISNFNTSSVTDMSGMFYNCSSLAELDISNFDTSGINNMLYMFYNCSNLTTIHGVIDMKSCLRYGGMFLHCDKLKNIKIKNPPGIFSGEGLSEDQYIIVS